MNHYASFLLFLVLIMAAQTTNAEEQTLYIGTSATGIYSCTLNMETGEMSEPKMAVEAPRPGFLALHPNKKFLYAVTAEKSKPSGGVRAFEINHDSRTLKQINQVSSGDDGATHLEVNRAGTTIVVSHYSGGSTAALPINDDGSVGEPIGFVKHEGKSVNERRQEKPHAHGSAISHDGKYVCIADLGTDLIDVYELSPKAELSLTAIHKSKPGAGPRHLMFHPNGEWLYSINELDQTMTALTFDKENGLLFEIETVTTLPADYKGENSTAELSIHPNGRFIYGSNRGHDSTAAYAINQENGKLTLIEIEPTQGGHPRFIGLDPTGKFLIAANRDSDNLVSFHVNQGNGELTPTGHQAKAPKPICVVFITSK